MTDVTRGISAKPRRSSTSRGVVGLQINSRLLNCQRGNHPTRCQAIAFQICWNRQEFGRDLPDATAMNTYNLTRFAGWAILDGRGNEPRVCNASRAGRLGRCDGGQRRAERPGRDRVRRSVPSPVPGGRRDPRACGAHDTGNAGTRGRAAGDASSCDACACPVKRALIAMFVPLHDTNPTRFVRIRW